MSPAPTPVPPEQLGIELPAPYLWTKPTRPILAGLAIASVARLAPYFTDWTPRDILPEPIDIPDHVGNAAVTFALVDRALKYTRTREPRALTIEEQKASRRKTAVTVGAMAVALNTYAEMVGYGSISTPDILDFMYGLGGGALAYFGNKPRYTRPEVINGVMNSPSSAEDPQLDQIKARMREIIVKRAGKPSPTWPRQPKPAGSSVGQRVQPRSKQRNPNFKKKR